MICRDRAPIPAAQGIATIMETLIEDSTLRITLPLLFCVMDFTTLGIREDASALANAIGTFTISR